MMCRFIPVYIRITSLELNYESQCYDKIVIYCPVRHRKTFQKKFFCNNLLI